MSTFRIEVGDCRDVMRGLDADSIDAIVTDPPYGLSFMGKAWDHAVPGPDYWKEAMRVLKPGGRLLAFAGTRTMHRMWCAIEDAGFTIEDTIAWLYGSGFPKHKSKLKPAYEPVCVARKGRVSPLNIDSCRIACAVEEVAQDDGRRVDLARGTTHDGYDRPNATAYRTGKRANRSGPFEVSGRWPANVALDEDAARAVNEASGERRRAGDFPSDAPRLSGGFALGQGTLYADSGGASRFFYTAKASRSEREHGLEGEPVQDGQKLNPSGIARRRAEAGTVTPLANHHPTVKPVDLMRWLVRLVTLPGETVLDPFTGSGTTGVACSIEGRRFIGIEISEEYAEIARRRIAAAPMSLFGAA